MHYAFFLESLYFSFQFCFVLFAAINGWTPTNFFWRSCLAFHLPRTLLLTFLDARVSPLQRRSHKMCFLGSDRDPTRHSSRALTAVEVAQKANRITEVKLSASWAWGLKPYDRNNPVAEVCSPGLDSVSSIL
jgi:hypothetical protein